MRLIKSKQLFTEFEVTAFIEQLPNKSSESAKILPRVGLSEIGNLYISYFVLYEE